MEAKESSILGRLSSPQPTHRCPYHHYYYDGHCYCKPTKLIGVVIALAIGQCCYYIIPLLPLLCLRGLPDEAPFRVSRAPISASAITTTTSTIPLPPLPPMPPLLAQQRWLTLTRRCCLSVLTHWLFCQCCCSAHVPVASSIDKPCLDVAKLRGRCSRTH